MYNLYSYEKKVRDSSSANQSPERVESFKDDRFERRRTELAIRYRERIADFIGKMNKVCKLTNTSFKY